jgi:hypothetical protein
VAMNWVELLKTIGIAIAAIAGLVTIIEKSISFYKYLTGRSKLLLEVENAEVVLNKQGAIAFKLSLVLGAFNGKVLLKQIILRNEKIQTSIIPPLFFPYSDRSLLDFLHSKQDIAGFITDYSRTGSLDSHYKYEVIRDYQIEEGNKRSITLLTGDISKNYANSLKHWKLIIKHGVNQTTICNLAFTSIFDSEK